MHFYSQSAFVELQETAPSVLLLTGCLWEQVHTFSRAVSWRVSHQNSSATILWNSCFAKPVPVQKLLACLMPLYLWHQLQSSCRTWLPCDWNEIRWREGLHSCSDTSCPLFGKAFNFAQVLQLCCCTVHTHKHRIQMFKDTYGSEPCGSGPNPCFELWNVEWIRHQLRSMLCAVYSDQPVSSTLMGACLAMWNCFNWMGVDPKLRMVQFRLELWNVSDIIQQWRKKINGCGEVWQCTQN